MRNSNRNNEAVILYQVISGMTAKYRNDDIVSAVQDTVCGTTTITTTQANVKIHTATIICA